MGKLCRKGSSLSEIVGLLQGQAAKVAAIYGFTCISQVVHRNFGSLVACWWGVYFFAVRAVIFVGHLRKGENRKKDEREKKRKVYKL